MASSYRRELEQWLSQLEVRAYCVLDIGGLQSPVRKRVKLWDVTHYAIYDLEQGHEGNSSPDVICDLNDEFYLTNCRPRADLIFCLEVFEYVFHPVNALRVIASLLLPDGRAWVSFPTLYPLHQPIEDDCLRYMPAGIKKLATAAGLEVTQMIARKPETNLWMHFVSAERMRAAKGEDHSFTGFICEFKLK